MNRQRGTRLLVYLFFLNYCKSLALPSAIFFSPVYGAASNAEAASDLTNDKWKFHYEKAASRIEKGKTAFDEIVYLKQKAEADIARYRDLRSVHFSSTYANVNGNHRLQSSGSISLSEREKTQIMKAESEMGCWAFVLQQLETLKLESCDSLGEASRALIALARTKCHFLKAERRFPTEVEDGCFLNVHSLTAEQIAELLIDKTELPSGKVLTEELKPEVLMYEFVEEKTNDNGTSSDEAATGKSSEDTRYKCHHSCHMSKDPPSQNNKINNANLYNANSYNPCIRVMEMSKEFSESDTMQGSSYQNDLDVRMCDAIKHKMVKQCTRQFVMSDTAFQIYLNDLNHIDDICFYLESSAWNKKTETNINRLSQSASIVASKLEGSIDGMFKLEELQTKQLERSNIFQAWLAGIKVDFQDLFKLLHGMKEIQSFFADFILEFKSILYFLSFAIFALLFTIPEAANGARPKLFLLLFFHGAIEVFLNKRYAYGEDTTGDWNSRKAELQELIKAFRWVFLTIECAIWLKTVRNFKPPLQEVKAQVDKIAVMMKEGNKAGSDVSVEKVKRSGSMERLENWMKYIKELDADAASEDPDYLNSTLRNEEGPSSANATSDESDAGEGVGNDTIQLIEEARMNGDVTFSGSFMSTVSTKNLTGKGVRRRNPTRNARPLVYDAIPMVGAGELMVEHPEEFVRRVEDQSRMWRIKHKQSLKNLKHEG